VSLRAGVLAGLSALAVWLLTLLVLGPMAAFFFAALFWMVARICGWYPRR
jgi:hypothetical protein